MIIINKMIRLRLLNFLGEGNVRAVNLRSGARTVTSKTICQEESENNRNSLWFTTLPKASVSKILNRSKKGRSVKDKKLPLMQPGPLLIACKNKKLDHYKGTFYKKFTPLPLASKGWHSKKSNGDYFSILPTRRNPAFLLPENFPVNEMFDENKTDPDEFSSLGISDVFINNLKQTGIHYPTGVQLAAIPKLLNGKNVLITAETGCGKTLAYLLPILEHIMKWKPYISREHNTPLALIVVPTRELALQVSDVIYGLIEGTDITRKVVLAERTKKFLLKFNPSNLEEVDIVVTTLGIMCKLSYHKVYELNKCLHVVIDEADTLLDDSFANKLQKLLTRCRIRMFDSPDGVTPKGAQLSLVSATIPKWLESTLENIIPPESLDKVTTKYLHKILPHIKQNFIRCKKSDKPQKLLDLVKMEVGKKRSVIVFSNYTKTAKWLGHFFQFHNIEHSQFNKLMLNEERISELEKFREGKVFVITCTDLASRGHDIPKVCHVVNYEFPRYMADYVHRCGRTGRIGNDASCEVTSLISKKSEIQLLNSIELAARKEDQLPGVNNNITRIIRNKYENETEEDAKKRRQASYNWRAKRLLLRNRGFAGSLLEKKRKALLEGKKEAAASTLASGETSS